jgi:hypothetical protein
MIPSHALELSFPMELSAQRPHSSLTTKLSDQAQAFFDHRPLGCVRAGLERRRHELIVDYDIRPHDVYYSQEYTHRQTSAIGSDWRTSVRGVAHWR